MKAYLPESGVIRYGAYLFGVVFLVLLALIISCEKETVIQPDESEGTPAAIQVSVSGCKLFDEGAFGIRGRATLDCIGYAYDESEGILSLTHVNAGFNCCPGEIQFDVVIQEDTIIIAEQETEAGCHCLCLFDLDYEIRNLPAGEYTFIVVEEYLPEGGEVLKFTVDLSSDPSGTVCVARHAYPWSLDRQPKGELVDHSTCTGSAAASENVAASADNECVAYQFDGAWLLELRHLNALFNCCPDSITAEVDIEGMNISIEEAEWLGEGGGCDCLCRIDLDIDIHDLASGEYTITVQRPYGGLECLQFTVDLSSATTGKYCLTGSQ